MLEELIKQLQDLESKAAELRFSIRNYNDGFIYLTCLRCYGSISWETYTNEFCAQELCNEYYGDNGIVDVYTNNSNNSIQSYGSVTVMSLDEMQNLSKKNISMSSAITNWITAGI